MSTTMSKMCVAATYFLSVCAFVYLAFFVPLTTYASETPVDETVNATNANALVGSPTAVWTSDTDGYVFYLGAEGDLEMASTTDAGETWTGGRTVDSVNTTDVVSYAVWWDGWTAPGTTTQYIHIATSDLGNDDLYYTRYDITNNTLSSSATSSAGVATCTNAASCYVSIAKSSDNALFMTLADAQDAFVMRCTTTCTTGSNWATSTGAYRTPGDDYPLLMPVGGNNNMQLVWWDASADLVNYNIYSATSSSWFFSATTSIGTVKDDNLTYDVQLIGMGHSTTTGVAGLAFVDNANDYTTNDHVINFYTFASTSGWTTRTNVIDAASGGGLTAAKVSYDESTGTWYVIYAKRHSIGASAMTNIYYRTSTTSGATWSGEMGPINESSDDINGLTTAITSRERIGAWWNYSTSPQQDQEWYGLVADVGTGARGAPFLLSGTIYSDEGRTRITAGEPIAIAIGTSTPSVHATTSTASGYWSFTLDANHTVTSSTPIVVWVDDDPSVRAAHFTKAMGPTTMQNLDLYQNRVIVNSHSTTTTNSDMSFYDRDQDSSIQYNASSTARTLEVSTGNELYIWPSRVFRPEGNVTIHGNAAGGLDGNFRLSRYSTYLQTGSTTIGGSFLASSSAKFFNNGGTLIFTASTTGKSILAPYALGEVKINTTANITMIATSSSATTSHLTIASGATFTPTSTLFISGNYENNGTFNNNGATTTFGNTGTLWVARSAAAANIWDSITYGNGLFVAVSNSGASRVMTSTNGTSWTSRTAAAAQVWDSITYGNGLFVAVSSSGTSTQNAVMTSPDGVAWTARSGSTASSWREVVYGNGIFVATSDSGAERVMTSPDGITWTTRTAAEANDWYGLAYGNGLFVAVSSSGTNRVMTSPDGVTWSPQSAAAAHAWDSVAYGNGLFVAVGQFAPVMTSPDGVNWTLRSIPDDEIWSSVTYGNGLFVAVSTSGTNRVMTSPDGVTWTVHPATEANAWGTITFGNGLFVAVSSDGTNRVMTSSSSVITSGYSQSIQTATGTMTGTSAFGTLGFIGSSTKQLITSASTTHFVNATTSEVQIRDTLSISGTMTNIGKYEARAGLNTWRSATSSDVDATNWRGIAYGNGLFVAVSNSGTNLVMTSPDGITWTPRSAAVGNQWYGITYGNGLFVAVSGDGTNQAMTSPDGITWTSRSTPEANLWYSVTYGNNLFVAVSQTGTNRVMTSPDGITWTARSAAEANSWYSVTYGNGLFVAIALTGTNRVMTSPDGITWTARSAAEANSWRSVTYGNGIFVAVSSDGTNRVMTSPDGITWTPRAAAEANQWFTVTYGNGLFVAIALTGTNRVMTSPDGITWTARSAAEANSWYSVTYGGGRFIAVSLDGSNRVMYSKDATTTFNGTSSQTITDSFNATSTFGNLHITGTGTKTFIGNASTTNLLVDAGATFVAPASLSVYGNYTNTATSTFTPGRTWTARAAAAANSWNSVTYGNGLFVAVADSGASRVMTSPDGITWTSRTAAEANTWNSVTYGNGLFVAVSGDGTNRIMTSPDGITWTARTAAEANIWDSITYGNGLFVAVSQDGTNRVMTSPDGITWTARTAAAANTWNSVTYGNGLFVAVSTDGTNRVMTSPDGITWTERTAVSSVIWTSVTYGNGLFVAVASMDDLAVATTTLMTSPDGITWTARTAAAANAWDTVTYGNGLFVAVSTDGTNRVMTSPDGITWTPRTAAEANNWTSVTYGNNLFVSVSNGGTNQVMTAPSPILHLGGNATQTLSGTMVATSSFNDIRIANTSGNGSTTQSINFAAAFNASGTLSMAPETSARFLAGATTTLFAVDLQGVLGRYVWLRSSVSGSQYNFYVPGRQENVRYVNVKDNNACPVTIEPVGSIDSGNNLCWSFSNNTLSGILYSDMGATPITSGKTIRIAIGTTTPSIHSTTTNASGNWSFTLGTEHGISSSTPILIWVDNDATTRAALFTKASTTRSIGGLDLYQDRVIISHEGTTGTSTSIDDLAFYDNDNDTDIQYNAASTTNTLVVNAGSELYIKTGKTFIPGGDVTVRGNASAAVTDGTLRLPGTAAYTNGGVTTLAGSFLASSTAYYTHNNKMLVMNASTTGKTILYATSSTLGNITLAGTGNGGGWTLGTSSATTTHLYIATSSTLTAPTTLTVQGDFVNMGNLVHSSGTIRMASTSNHTITTRDATTTAFGNLTIGSTGPVTHNTSLFTVATDTSDTRVYSLTIDTTNGVLYAGSWSSGIIYRCATSTGCDSAGDFTTATDTAETVLESLTVDQTNGVLYAGSGSNGIIYRCATSTGCDSSGDFTTAVDTAATSIYSLTIDTTNGVLYAGSGGGGIIYRCATSTGCDSAGDFTTATDTAATTIDSLTIDTTNGVLYAGSGSGGIIYRCATSTGCDSAGDFTTATDTAETVIYSLVVDTVNGVLYAGTNPSGFIYRCATSTGCDDAGDFTTANDTPGTSYIRSLTIDTINSVLYAGVDNGGIIYRCATSTGCDSAGDFITATDTPESTIFSLTVDTTNGVLYAGAGITYGFIYRCVTPTGCDANALSATTTAINLTIQSGSSYTPNTTTELRGNYTNNGTSTFNTDSSLFLNGGSAQTLSGTLVATSALPSVTFSGGGTKTFSNNASTTNFTIETAAAVIASSSLTIGGNYTNNGIFTAGASTTFTGIGYTATGTMVGTSAFNTLSVGGSGSLNMSTATDTAASIVYSLTVDTTNGVLYAGSGSTDGIIYRCATSTGCDSAGDFTIATDTAASGTLSLTVDTINGVLYGGSAASGIIYRCATSTGCDSVGDFTTATDTAASIVYSLTVDTTNGVLYAGGSSGIIYRCATSTGCDEGDDFTTATDTAASSILSLTVDTTNGVLYGGSGSTDGIIYRCATSTGCDSVGDFTTATDTAETSILSLTVDTTNGVLYAGTNSGGIIYRCVTATGCDSVGDFTTATDTDTAASGILSLTVDTTNGVLFAGASGGIIYRCVTATGCDSVGDFTTATDTAASTVYSLSVDTTNGVLYAGSSIGGIIYRAPLNTIFGSNASTSNLTIQSGASLLAPTELTIGGSYTNSGTFRANGGTTTFTGVGYTATGTLTGTSSFNNLVLEGSGTFNPSTIDIGGGTYIASLAIDTVNGVLYGGRNNGVIFRCVLSTGCDEPSDFATAYDTTEVEIESLAIDTINGVLYAGSSGSGIIYRCATSTGCDSAGDFTTATDTAASDIWSLTVDTTNGVLYAGSNNSGIIYRCATSTGCDEGTDFTVATDTAATEIWSLTIDTTNGVLYAGSGGSGIIYRCVLSTGCDSVGDFTIAVDTVSSNINSFTIDTVNGVLYAGITSTNLYSCVLSTGCDASGDFTTISGFAYSTRNLAMDSINGVLYIGTESTGVIYRCSIALTGCDSASDFSVASDTPESNLRSSAIDESSGVLYIGGWPNGNIYRTPLATTFVTQASTTNIRINTGGLIASSSLSVSGNLTNNGRFINNTGTLSLSSSTANQTLSGNFVGFNDLGNMALTGTSSKTFASNASTTNLTIESGATMIAPTALSITGNYANSGTTTYSSGTTTLSGTATQTMSGTMIGSSAFSNLSITNTSGLGSTTQSIIFTAPASTTGTFTMAPSTSVQFLANSTSTFQNISLNGDANSYAWLRSSAPGTQYGFYVPGNQSLVEYVDVKDNNACPTTIDAGGTSVDAGNNTCWSFAGVGSPVLSSAAAQRFAYNQATTTLSTITVTDAATPSITAANDLRIKIATSTVRMRFDTTDTTATLGGTASGKVSGTVSYEGGGSVLVLDVTSNFSASDTLTISDLSFAQFSAVNATATALTLYTGGAADTGADATDDKQVAIVGAVTLTDHSQGQVDDNFSFSTESNVELFGFAMTPGGEDMSITPIIFTLSGAHRFTTSELSNLALYRDMNNDGLYDVGDIAVGGTGALSLNAQTGSITFTDPFPATTTRDYLLTGDLNDVPNGGMVVITLDATLVRATGTVTGSAIVEGSVSRVQHVKGSYAASSNGIDAAPAGDGIRTGGDEGAGVVDPNSGDSIGNEVGFNAPSSTGINEWTNGSSAYASDGAYATIGTSGTQSYGTFGFSIPNNNQITGIAVKLESSASSNAGTISVRLSWDNGTSDTTELTTATLTTTDGVYTLGGQGNTWGRSWTPSEFNNGSFIIEVVGNPSSNTVRIDALQVKVFHQATGGGKGGGPVVTRTSESYFANVTSAVTDTLRAWWRGLWE